MNPAQDRRARDWGYIATVPAVDLPVYQAMAQEIQQTHNTALIEEFNDACERQDRRFITVTKAEDLIMNVGIQECLNIVLGNSSTLFRYMARGTGTAAAAVTNTGLGAEALSRINMSSPGLGWREAQGMKMFFGAIGSEVEATTTFTELGVFTAISGGTMLNREVFASNSIAHVGPKLATIFSSVIEFCPVA